MEKLKAEYESLDEIPEAFRELYTEDDGRVILTGVQGVKPENDIQKLQTALESERNAHKEAKNALKPWKDMDPDKVRSDLARIKELEAAAGGKLDDAGIQKLVEQRLPEHVNPIKQQLEETVSQLESIKQENESLKAANERRELHDAIRSVAQEAQVLSEALPDVIMVAETMLTRSESGKLVTKEGINGITPGMSPAHLMKELRQRKPYYWPQSGGGGAAGGGSAPGGGPNPFTAENWSLTEQGRIYRADPQAAERLAKSAGTKIGGPKPPAKK